MQLSGSGQGDSGGISKISEYIMKYSSLLYNFRSEFDCDDCEDV